MQISVPQQVYSAKQVLENESLVAKTQGIAMYPLMEQAGAAVFAEIAKLPLVNRRILVLCGKGNNGGDGFVVARLALAAGYKVTTLVLTKVAEAKKTTSELLKGEAKTAFEHLLAASHQPIWLDNINDFNRCVNEQTFDLVVDAVLGIGFSGELPEFFQQVFSYINQQGAVKIAVDLPSGVNATTGAVAHIAICCDLTITFIVPKQGLYTGAAVNYCGHIKLADLSINNSFNKEVSTNTLLQVQDNLPSLAKRKPNSHKGNVGHILTIGGNKNMPGAIRLASEAALRTGAALVSVCSHKDNRLLVHQQAELMIAGHNLKELQQNQNLQKIRQLLIGPGLGIDRWAQTLFRYACSLNLPMVVDADALTLLSQKPHYYTHWVLTPHPGEAARLLSCSVVEIEKDRFSAAQKIAQQYGGICLLKGAGTIITDGNVCYINTTGNPAMASGGMGDVLTGIIAALMLQLSDNLAAARLAAFIHGAIADQIVAQQGSIGLLASDIIAALPTTLNQYS